MEPEGQVATEQVVVYALLRSRHQTPDVKRSAHEEGGRR